MDIVHVMKYKRAGALPASADDDKKRAAFKTKYQFFKLSKDGKNLMYTPANLQVVSKINRKMILTKEYKNSFGSGSRNFYKTIREKYLNIKRSDIAEFMKTQTVTQLTDGFKHGKTLVPPGGVLTSTPPYPLVPAEERSVLTLVPPTPTVLKTGTQNKH